MARACAVRRAARRYCRPMAAWTESRPCVRACVAGLERRSAIQAVRRGSRAYAAGAILPATGWAAQRWAKHRRTLGPRFGAISRKDLPSACADCIKAHFVTAKRHRPPRPFSRRHAHAPTTPHLIAQHALEQRAKAQLIKSAADLPTRPDTTARKYEGIQSAWHGSCARAQAQAGNSSGES